MVQRVEAVYENGVLRPLQPLDLKDAEQVRLVVSTGTAAEEDDSIDHTMLAYARKRVAEADRIPTHEEVRESLSVIKESMSELILAERGEY